MHVQQYPVVVTKSVKTNKSSNFTDIFHNSKQFNCLLRYDIQNGILISKTSKEITLNNIKHHGCTPAVGEEYVGTMVKPFSH